MVCNGECNPGAKTTEAGGRGCKASSPSLYTSSVVLGLSLVCGGHSIQDGGQIDGTIRSRQSHKQKAIGYFQVALTLIVKGRLLA